MNGYLQDPHSNETTLLAGVTLDFNTVLHWITDKIFVPNISTLKDRVVTEFYTTAGHPDVENSCGHFTLFSLA